MIIFALFFIAEHPNCEAGNLQPYPWQSPVESLRKPGIGRIKSKGKLLICTIYNFDFCSQEDIIHSVHKVYYDVT